MFYGVRQSQLTNPVQAVLKTQSLGVQLGLRPTIFLQMQCNGKGAVPVSTVLGYLLQRSSMCRLVTLAEGSVFCICFLHVACRHSSSSKPLSVHCLLALYLDCLLRTPFPSFSRCDSRRFHREYTQTAMIYVGPAF